MGTVIDNIVVKRGELVRGSLKVGELPDTSPVLIPVTVVSGIKEGPTILVMAALHGNEVNGPEICFRLTNELKPEKISGNIIIVPIANPLAYNARTRSTPQDGKDLNRYFPGKRDGSLTEKLAYTLFNSLIKKSDFVIDIHSGSEHFRLVPFIKIFADLDYFSYSKFFNIRFVKIRNTISKSLTGEAMKKGVKSVCIEVGEGGRLETDLVEKIKEGILNFLKRKGVLEGEVHKTKTIQLYHEKRFYSSKGGLLIPRVEVGQKVKKNSILGEIHDPFTGGVTLVKTEVAGWVVGIKKSPQTFTGEKAFIIYH